MAEPQRDGSCTPGGHSAAPSGLTADADSAFQGLTPLAIDYRRSAAACAPSVTCLSRFRRRADQVYRPLLLGTHSPAIAQGHLCANAKRTPAGRGRRARNR
jgi:hypothetical protein